jgi:cyclopropane fatty-acyl-phospholipid synthase-like methyltransferase
MSNESPVTAPDPWDSYWEQLTGRQQLYREQAREYVRNLLASGLVGRGLRVLDFGCGFGFVARGLAGHVGELYLWDASANMRCRAAKAVAACRNVRLIDRMPEQAPPLPPVDRILINSVVQYMPPAEFGRWLHIWRSMLAPGGLVVLSDLIPPGRPAMADVIDLVKFVARRRFLIRAVWQALGDVVRYSGRRRASPLTRLGEQDVTRLAAESGLSVTILEYNLTHFRGRVTAVCSPRLAA